MAAEGEGFTPTQRKMLDVLSDGRPHTRQEMHACLRDDLGPLTNIQMHISGIRKKIRPKGEDVVCVVNKGSFWYMHVRLLPSAINGHR